MNTTLPARPLVLVTGRRTPQVDGLLTPPALRFLAELNRRFEGRRQQLIQLERRTLCGYRHGKDPAFPAETEWIRTGGWSIARPPADLPSRRIELAGDVDRRSVVSGLNSAADVYVADFTNQAVPGWSNTVRGHVNLRDAADGTIAFEDDRGYHAAAPDGAALMVRPRGWHTVEPNLLVDGRPMSASLFDAGLYAFHCARKLRARGTGAYFCLPRVDSYVDARLWHDVFTTIEEQLSLPTGSIRATAVIGSVTSAFQMEEILYELRDHITGLRFGRWDYVASFIRAFRDRREYVMPDGAAIDHGQRFLSEVCDEMVRAAHRRGAHAIGGKLVHQGGPPSLEPLMNDIVRHIEAGFDGVHVPDTMVADLARGVIDARVTHAAPINPPDADDRTAALLAAPEGLVTELGLRNNVNLVVRYLARWLGGPPHHKGLGVAHTGAAELARLQLWHWVKHATALEDGRVITNDLLHQLFDEERTRLHARRGDRLDAAVTLGFRLSTGPFRDRIVDLEGLELTAA